MASQLPHTERIAKLLREGKRAEARRVHNAYVDSQLRKASQGPINLSDLMAGKEAFIVDDIDRGRARRRGHAATPHRHAHSR